MYYGGFVTFAVGALATFALHSLGAHEWLTKAVAISSVGGAFVCFVMAPFQIVNCLTRKDKPTTVEMHEKNGR